MIPTPCFPMHAANHWHMHRTPELHIQNPFPIDSHQLILGVWSSLGALAVAIRMYFLSISVRLNGDVLDSLSIAEMVAVNDSSRLVPEVNEAVLSIVHGGLLVLAHQGVSLKSDSDLGLLCSDHQVSGLQVLLDESHAGFEVGEVAGGDVAGGYLEVGLGGGNCECSADEGGGRQDGDESCD